MVCLVRKRGVFCRRVLKDVWGHYSVYVTPERYKREKLRDKTLIFWRNYRKKRRSFRRFMRQRYVYKLWGREKFKFKKRFKDSFLHPRLLKNFYLVLTRVSFLRYVERARCSVYFFINQLLLFLENRLFMLAYRLNFINNLFIMKYCIKLGIFFVDGKIRKHFNFVVKLGHFVFIVEPWLTLVKQDMLFRCEQYIPFMPFPGYMYMSYTNMFCFSFRPLEYKDVVYPINLDVLRVLDFVGPLR